MNVALHLPIQRYYQKEPTMPHPITISSGQWWDIPFEKLCSKMSDLGYDGIELNCMGDHFEVDRALSDDSYLRHHRDILEKRNLKCYAISNHGVGQLVCDQIDERHKGLVSSTIWGDGKEGGIRQRASENMKNTARAAALFGAAE